MKSTTGRVHARALARKRETAREMYNVILSDRADTHPSHLHVRASRSGRGGEGCSKRLLHVLSRRMEEGRGGVVRMEGECLIAVERW